MPSFRTAATFKLQDSKQIVDQAHNSSSLGRACFAFNFYHWKLKVIANLHMYSPQMWKWLDKSTSKAATTAMRWPQIESVLEHHSNKRRRLYQRTLQRYPGPTSWSKVFQPVSQIGCGGLSSQQIPSTIAHFPQIPGARFSRSTEVQETMVFDCDWMVDSRHAL